MFRLGVNVEHRDSVMSPRTDRFQSLGPLTDSSRLAGMELGAALRVGKKRQVCYSIGSRRVCAEEAVEAVVGRANGAHRLCYLWSCACTTVYGRAVLDDRRRKR
jgi:hypothetical protein